MKKIFISLGIIGIVAAVAISATTAIFSDEETSLGNTFTAGTIDISVNDMNPWSQSFTLTDMKPSYTDYIKFKISNVNADPNPVNVFKEIRVISEETGTVTEPECTEQDGIWHDVPGQGYCEWISDRDLGQDNNNLSAAIWYDMNVEVYDASGAKVWWQTMYLDADHKTIDQAYGQGRIFLGMIPANGYMMVEQSYHLATETTNWAQGDTMTFDIILNAEQLQGIAWLENKQIPGTWQILYGDGIQGTLTYDVKGPKFDFTFTGKTPLANTEYVLAAGYDSGSNVDTYLGEGTTDASGNINFSGSIELDKNLKDKKVWLLTKTGWNNGTISWGSMANWLWETGMIWYEDTDL